MKLINGIVRPSRLDAVKAALDRIRVNDVMVTSVQDHAQRGHGSTVWRGHVYELGYSQRLEIRFVVDDEDVDEAVQAVMRAARTGENGDGHVSVIAVEHRYNIQTGAREAS